jgi:cell division protein FtsZ
VEALLDGALFEQGKVLSRATALVVCVLGGPDLTIPDVETVMAVIRKAAKPGCHLDMGTVVDDEWGGRLMVSVLASEQSSESASAGRARSSDASEVPAGGRDAAQGVGRKKRAKPDHPSLRFEDPGKGRFKDAEPTILDGEDMDIPTFIRRGIPIER